MTIKKVLYIVLGSLIFITPYSCSKDKKEDTKGPAITLIEPKEKDSFKRGQEIHVDFDLVDESGINTYKIDIHWGEGHTHGYAAESKADVVAETQWSYLKIFDDKKGEKDAHVHIHIDVPATIKVGDYHFLVSAIDLKGNESRKYVTIKVE